MAILTFATGWAFAGLLFTTAISGILFVLYITNWHGTEFFAQWVGNNRSLVAVIVQILSHIFGMIQVQALCAVIKLSFRLQATKSTITLEFARFINAISIPRAVWRGQGSLIFASAVIFALSIVPGALWSGAITPQIIEHTLTRSVPVADLSGWNTSNQWTAESALGPSPWLTQKGLFSFDADDRTELLIGSAREASVQRQFNDSGNYTYHAKLDSTGFSFIGRSFGGGSATGLVNVSDVHEPVWYQYEEDCIVSSVNCFKNFSSNFTLYDQTCQIDGPFEGLSGAKFLAVAAGTFPSGQSAAGQWHNGATGHDLFAMDGDYNSRISNVLLTTGATNATKDDPWSFAQFNASQCVAHFQASSCSVFVNMTQMSIQVSNSSSQAWPTYGDDFAETAIYAVRILSTVDNAFGGSRLGRSLVLNTRYLRSLIEGDFSPENIPEDILFTSLSQYLASIFDNELGALRAAQLVGRNASKAVPALVGVRAVQYGSAAYIYAIFVIDVLILLVCVVQAIRTKFWAEASALDFTDFSQLVLCTSKGGSQLYRASQAGSADHINRVRFALQDSPDGFPALVYADDPGRYTKPGVAELPDTHLLGLELQETGSQRSNSSQGYHSRDPSDFDGITNPGESSTSGYQSGQRATYRPSW